MPKTKISEFSATPANNTDIDSINIAEGCAPSGINDAIRELMAQLKDFQTGAVGDSFNGPVGTTTPAAGAFTTLSATGNVTLGDASTDTLNVGNGGLIKDASGNLGLGVTPNAGWGGNTRAYDLQFYNTFSGGDDGSRAYMALGSNFYESGGGAPKYKVTNVNIPATMYKQRNGEHQWLYAPSGTAGNAITFTQAMTLDADGDWALGTTDTSQKRAYIVETNNTTGVTYGLKVGNISFTTDTRAGVVFQNGDNNGSAIWSLRTGSAAGTLVFGTNSGGGTSESNIAERARIDSSGRLLVGCTTGAQGRVAISGSGGTTSSGDIVLDSNASYSEIQSYNSKPLYINRQGNAILMPQVYSGFTNANAANMYIGTDGTLYRSVSSEKYKTDIQTAAYGLADVMNLRAVTYRAKSSISKNDAGEETTVNASVQVFGGLIAEEVHNAGLTQFVQYSEDGTPDALSYGHMVSLAFKAIQEQQAIIESLKARLDAANL